MNDQQKTTAEACLKAADDGSMTFPQIVGRLIDAGFESYAIDFRRRTAIYFLPDGASIELPTHKVESAIAPTFDVEGLQAAIRDAQQLVPGYTYRGFCERAAAAGCTGYTVSFIGRRALYIGRGAQTHVEPFPDQ